MSLVKFGLVIAVATLIGAPTTAEAQSFTQRGTRTGAIAGAIIGGVIGDQRNNAFTGAVIGGLVGGAAGRVVGRSKDSQLYAGNKYYGDSQTYRQSSYSPRQSYYGGGYKSNIGIQNSRGYGGRYGGSCPYGGR